MITNINPLMGTLKSQRNGPLYRNTVIGTHCKRKILKVSNKKYSMHGAYIE